MWKKREWYQLAPEERMRIMRDHIEVARRFTGSRRTPPTRSVDDQEFVVAFDTDDPAEFLDLVHEPRATESSAYTESETPIFTCIGSSIERALDASMERPSGRRRSVLRRFEQLLERAQLHARAPCGSPASRSARSTACQPA